MVCLIATMNARAGITVVPPEETESDYYLLTLSGTVTASDWTNLSGHVKNAKSLKIVTEDYKMSSTDMDKLMGNGSASLFSNFLERLDMGDAEINDYSDLSRMSIASNKNGNGLHELKYFVFPKNTNVIPIGMFTDNSTIEEVIMLERDDTNLSGFTDIPTNCFLNCSHLKNVRIPEGVTTIGASAFGGNDSYGTFTGPIFESIHLPNTLRSIGNAAFSCCSQLKSVTIPSNVNFIQKHAFQKNVSMTDVYILGDNVQIGDEAFDHTLTNDGFKYDSNKDGNSNIVSIVDWRKDNGVVPLRLHFANNEVAKQHYMNPSLRLLNDLDNPAVIKQAIIEATSNKNPSDDEVNTAIRKIYDSIENGWFDWITEPTNPIHGTDYKDIFDHLKGKYGSTAAYSLFKSEDWVVMEGKKYFTSAEGKFNFDTNDLGDEGTDYRGWHNFMFAAGDLKEKTWPDKRMIESRWYSAVFPFNLSYNQLMTAYGNGTDVREFTGVERSTNSDGKTVLKITFNDRAVVPGDHDANEDGNTYIIKGHPYMIHPGVRSVPVGEGETAVYRTIAGVSVEEANNVISTEQPSTVHGDLKEGNAIIKAKAYTFVGTYKEEGDFLPKHCYYLGMYTNRPETLGFYYTKSAGTTNRNWKQFTSIVKVSDELKDAGAKFMDMDFSVINHDVFNDDYGIATGITNTSIEQVGTDIIYNLNGQVVGKGSLQGMSKGIYVVNGKKIVVR